MRNCVGIVFVLLLGCLWIGSSAVAQTPTPTAAIPCFVDQDCPRGQVCVDRICRSAATPTPAGLCVGDCDGNGEVTADEVATCQNIELGTVPISACPACDANGDGMVSADEVAIAQQNSLNGCPFPPTPTPPPPPPNDNFANATLITALPFTDNVDTTAASFEPGEPTPSCFNAQNGTVWYAFKPSVSGSVSANINAPFSTVVAAYTGASLASLTPVGCQLFGQVLTLHVNAGTSYFFQVAGIFGESGPLQFQLNVTPAPVANFYFYPPDPSIYDTVQFIDSSFDPGQVGLQSFMWDFGDGTTATGSFPTHRYAADADYTVHETVTTVDGRTASTSQVVHVQTHDVAITKFSAPNAASSGQTRQISVGINSKRSAENVEVDLFKSVPGGFLFVGSLTQFVPVRPSNRTTEFDFSYTFTRDDAAIGKVTFRVDATILGARDALPADNEAISSPTKLNR